MEDEPERQPFIMADELIKKWDRTKKHRFNARFQMVVRTLMILLFLAIMVFLIYILITLLIDRMGW